MGSERKSGGSCVQDGTEGRQVSDRHKGQSQKEAGGTPEGQLLSSGGKPGSWAGRLKSLFTISGRGMQPVYACNQLSRSRRSVDLVARLLRVSLFTILQMKLISCSVLTIHAVLTAVIPDCIADTMNACLLQSLPQSQCIQASQVLSGRALLAHSGPSRHLQL